MVVMGLPASTTGKCFGAHPAMTALIAAFSHVNRPPLGATVPSVVSAASVVADSMNLRRRGMIVPPTAAPHTSI